MNQSQSPTSPDSAPSLSKRRGKGTIGSQTHETGLVPAARTRQMQFLIKVQLRRTLIPLPRDTVSRASFAVRTRGGYPKKFPWELFRYLRGTASHLEQGLSAAEVRRGRQDRAHRMPRRPIFTPHSGSNIKGNPAQLKLRRFTEILRPDVVVIFCNTLVLLQNHA